MSTRNILVTGMSGLIGNAVRNRLESKYTLRALNRRHISGLECYQADIVNLEEIQPAFNDQDVVVHLAAAVDGGASWDDLLGPNVIGTYNVFEAARRAGVKRIIYASSGATISDWERESPYGEIAGGDYKQVPDNWTKLTHESVTRPSGLYGCTKVWGEALARHFSDTYDISVICLRIGAVNQENQPTSPRHFSVWCSQDDIAQMVEKCIEAPDGLQFDTFFVVSDNKWSYRDISHSKTVVGYHPKDAAEEHRRDS